MTPKSLAPSTPDRSLKGRIAQKSDLLGRLMATAKSYAGQQDRVDFWESMADEVQADILELQHEGRNR